MLCVHSLWANLFWAYGKNSELHLYNYNILQSKLMMVFLWFSMTQDQKVSFNNYERHITKYSGGEPP